MQLELHTEADNDKVQQMAGTACGMRHVKMYGLARFQVCKNINPTRSSTVSVTNGSSHQKLELAQF